MTRLREHPACIVVGAGMAGLTAARALVDRGLPTVVLDKARGVGGRMATRWVDSGAPHSRRAVWDHGAQFFTARDRAFEARVGEWLAAGVARVWARGFPGEEGIGSAPRYCGSAGMSAIPRHLSRGLDVRLNQRVMSIEESDGRWKVLLEGSVVHEVEALLLSPPVPQSLVLLDSGRVRLPHSVRESLDRIAYAPCIAVLAHIEGPSRVPDPGGIRLSGERIAWIADNRQKGVSPEVTTITIHAGPEWSAAHWDADPGEVARLLVDAAGEWVGGEIRSRRLHRWRYSQPVILHEERCLASAGPPPLVFAGDAFGGPRVEGAALSGLAAAEQLISLAIGGSDRGDCPGKPGDGLARV